MYCSGFPGSPNSAISSRIRASRFFVRVEKLIDQISLNAHAALQHELQKEV
jgi:hypothetical protein